MKHVASRQRQSPRRGLHSQSPALRMGGTRGSPAADRKLSGLLSPGEPLGFPSLLCARAHTPHPLLSWVLSAASGRQPHFSAAPRASVGTDCCCGGIGGPRGGRSTVAPPTCRSQAPAFFTAPRAPPRQMEGEVRAGGRASISVLHPASFPSRSSQGWPALLASPLLCDSAGGSRWRAPW